jgi:hypothetical protein
MPSFPAKRPPIERSLNRTVNLPVPSLCLAQRHQIAPEIAAAVGLNEAGRGMIGLS